MTDPTAEPLLHALLALQLEEEKRKNLEGLGPQQPPFTVIPTAQSDQGMNGLLDLIGRIPWGKLLGKLGGGPGGGGGGGGGGAGGGGSDGRGLPGGSPGWSLPTRKDLPNLIGRR